jgi:dTDP-4-amino-4,6-dideoxygalactose transaminase
MLNIPFNKPFLTGNEIKYIQNAVQEGKLSGNGVYTKRCHDFFSQRYKFHKNLLTSSCTDALEMTALLLNIEPGDEVIVPSFTFVSSALAFVRQGAKIVFADSYAHHTNIDPEQLEALITKRTKAIVVVHYAGVACDMDLINQVAAKWNLVVIEDAAQAIHSNYKGQPLGSIGQLSCFSFHETKNIISGEGGMLVINDQQYDNRSEIIWEKGTNRAEFFRGEVNKYGWVDTGSSFLPSELTAAFLFAQLESIDEIQKRRMTLWELYYSNLKTLADQEKIELPFFPAYATNNAHMFYILCKNNEEREALIVKLKAHGILAVTHYISLHSSPYYHDKHDGRVLTHTDKFTAQLLRLPLFYELTEQQVNYISELIHSFFND